MECWNSGIMFKRTTSVFGSSLGSKKPRNWNGGIMKRYGFQSSSIPVVQLSMALWPDPSLVLGYELYPMSSKVLSQYGSEYVVQDGA